MDYHAVHGQDVSSFELPSTHRLPTVSAAEALENLDRTPLRCIPTGLTSLDKLLGGDISDDQAGGVQRGQVTEVWGPPGVGKTALGIQLTSNALRQHRGVVWVDAFFPVCAQRVSTIVGSETLADVDEDSDHDLLSRFVHYTCPTLAHFIALICRPTTAAFPEDTVLVVIDSLSAILNHSLPKTSQGGLSTSLKAPVSSSRRHQVLQYVVGALQKLAATRGVAVVVLTQCATRLYAEQGAALVPAITASIWEKGIPSRLVLFRDWSGVGDETAGLRFVGFQKVNGKTRQGRIEAGVAFTIGPNGLEEATLKPTSAPEAICATRGKKRKLSEAGFEVPDSDDEDYGWQDEDEDAMPNMPSQWQGSEDLLLGPDPDSEEEETRLSLTEVEEEEDV